MKRFRGFCVLFYCLSLVLVSCSDSDEMPGEEITAPIQAFQNEGGMWMPHQLLAPFHQNQLNELGLKLLGTDLTDPSKFPLGAVVSMRKSGRLSCSGSFVSPEGLLVTNHHCAIRCLQFTKKLDSGYVASDRSKELACQPSDTIQITKKFSDVTDEITSGLEKIEDPAERAKEIQRRSVNLVNACELDSGMRCEVSKAYEGAEYYLVAHLAIRDLRLVYAPSKGVGFFGGFVDNFKWPRHVGDFTFFRAYVGADGKPKDFAEDNVPYKPEHRFKLAERPLKSSDLVIVAGYPGSTNRLKSSFEVREFGEWEVQENIKLLQARDRAATKAQKANPALEKITANLILGVKNYLTFLEGVRTGFESFDIVGEKRKLEDEMRAWLEKAEPEKKEKYGDIFNQLKAFSDKYDLVRRKDSLQSSLLLPRFVRLQVAANTIVRKVFEAKKPDEERDPRYQERNWPNLKKNLEFEFGQYDRDLDKIIQRYLIKYVQGIEISEQGNQTGSRPEAEQPLEALQAMLGTKTPGDAEIATFQEALYANTELIKLETQKELFDKATWEDLEKSTDSYIQLAVKTLPLIIEEEKRAKVVSGELSVIHPIYVGLLRELKGRRLAADANATLRVTYGTVQGYRPRPNAPLYFPFTPLSEMIKKFDDNGGKPPFYLAKNVRQAFEAKAFGPYTFAALNQQIPVNFLANTDITGGNSGSATINGFGELVGLAFDINDEGLASDWKFLPQLTRSIHVDVRFMMWMMDAVDEADHLLEEMGVTPAIH